MNKCVRCERLLPDDSFYKDKRMKSGLSSECKECKRDRSKVNWAAGYAQAKLNDPDGVRKYNRAKSFKSNYGISIAEYDQMNTAQNGKCGICGSQEKLFVDHCHDTNVVRGLLCVRCNFGLGYFKDNIENLDNAIDYLSDFLARVSDLS